MTELSDLRRSHAKLVFFFLGPHCHPFWNGRRGQGASREVICGSLHGGFALYVTVRVWLPG